MNTYQSVFDHFKFITGQDSVSSADGIRLINFALNDYSAIAMEADGRWRFDDTRNTNAPRGYTAAVSGQGVYVVDRTFLKISQVHVKVNGAWKVLTQTDKKEHRDVPADQTYSTPGTPEKYDFDGQTITLLPAPNWTDAGDLTDTDNLTIRVIYTRPATYVTALSDALGIPSIHIGYLVLNAARQMGFRTIDSNRTDVRDELIKWEGTEIQGRRAGGKIRSFFETRDDDRPRRLKPKGDTAFMRRR